MTNSICTFFKQSGDFTNILGMIGIAIITALIPLAIAIFKDEKEFDALDKNVILDFVIKSKLFFAYIALIYVPLIMWNSSPVWLKLFELASWSAGVYFLAKILVGSYHWMKGKKFDLRFDYLRKLDDPGDMEESWNSVWATKSMNTQNEREFFKIFASKIEKLFKNE